MSGWFKWEPVHQLEDTAAHMQSGPRAAFLSSASSQRVVIEPRLICYRDDGRIEIDNNAAERALRGVALERRSRSRAMARRDGVDALALVC